MTFTPPESLGQTGSLRHRPQTRATGLAPRVKQINMYAAIFEAIRKQG